jgi:hypothetical protein
VSQTPPTEEQADALLNDFEAWLVRESKGGKLDTYERSILKTFLFWFWKVRG